MSCWVLAIRTFHTYYLRNVSENLVNSCFIKYNPNKSNNLPKGTCLVIGEVRTRSWKLCGRSLPRTPCLRKHILCPPNSTKLILASFSSFILPFSSSQKTVASLPSWFCQRYQKLIMREIKKKSRIFYKITSVLFKSVKFMKVKERSKVIPNQKKLKRHDMWFWAAFFAINDIKWKCFDV